MPGAMLDTNILLYAITTEAGEADKKGIARALLAGTDWGLSIQVLQEFYVNATRPPKPAMSHADVSALIDELLTRPTVVNDDKLLRDALRIKERYGIAFWDAGIVAAARALGAATLYSEDLSHGQDYDGVRVVNPFRAA